MASVVVLLVAGVVSATAVERRVAEEERRARVAAGRVDELDLPVPTTTAPAERAPTATSPATLVPVATEPRPTTTSTARPPTAHARVLPARPPRAFLIGDIDVKPGPLSVQGPRPPEILPGHPVRLTTGAS